MAWTETCPVDELDPVTSEWGGGGSRTAPRESRCREVGSIDAIELTADAGWLSQAYRKVSAMRSLPEGWCSYDSARPNERSISAAIQVLSMLAEFQIEPTHLDPSVEEGICISFRSGDRYADIECFNSGEVLAVTSDSASSEVWDVAVRGIENAVVRIGSFLDG